MRDLLLLAAKRPQSKNLYWDFDIFALTLLALYATIGPQGAQQLVPVTKSKVLLKFRWTKMGVPQFQISRFLHIDKCGKTWDNFAIREGSKSVETKS